MLLYVPTLCCNPASTATGPAGLPNTATAQVQGLAAPLCTFLQTGQLWQSAATVTSSSGASQPSSTQWQALPALQAMTATYQGTLVMLRRVWLWSSTFWLAAQSAHTLALVLLITLRGRGSALTPSDGALYLRTAAGLCATASLAQHRLHVQQKNRCAISCLARVTPRAVTERIMTGAS
jgi:hypothetical protein